MKQRCDWLSNDPVYIHYHDTEWGVEKDTDQELFEQLCLEGAQAGLSWLTVLKKREGYRELFHQFDLNKCACLSNEELEKILTNPKIIRHKLKVYSVRKNAQSTLKIIEEYGSFKAFLWEQIDYTPIITHFTTASEIPTQTIISESISKKLKKRGFSFVGGRIIYAYMQAIGMTIDHCTTCFLHEKNIKK